MTKKHLHKTLGILLTLSFFWRIELQSQSIPKLGQDYTLEIANWNLEWFGKTASGYGPSDDAKQQELVLKTIKNAGIDLWAFCEVSEKKAFDSLMLKLPDYQSVIAPYSPEQKTAILFKSALFTLLDYQLLGTDSPDSFSTQRFPLEVRLIPKQDIGIDTLRLIVIHLKANIGTDSAKMLAYNSRKRSAEWLKLYLNQLPKNNYTMVLGDWNDDLDVSIFNKLPSPFVQMLANNFEYTFLSKKFSDLNQGTTTGYPDAIDHQLASKALTLKHKTDSSFIWHLDQYIANYSSTCSDHYPVYSIFNQYKTALTAFQKESRSSIYPNPCQTYFSIQNPPGKCQVKIINSQFQTILFNEFEDHLNIPISEWPKGLYFVWIETDSTQEIFKLMVE